MNGTHTNGSSTSSKNEKVNGNGYRYDVKPERPLKDHPNGEWTAKRIDDDNDKSGREGENGGMWAQYKAMREVSKRPLPKEHGDGTYPKVQNRPSAMDNIRALQKRGE